MQGVPRAKAEIRLFYYTRYCLNSQPNLAPGTEVPNPGCFPRQEGSSAGPSFCDCDTTAQGAAPHPPPTTQHPKIQRAPAALAQHGNSSGRAAWVSSVWHHPPSYQTQSPSYLHMCSRVWECHQGPGAVGKYQAATL